MPHLVRLVLLLLVSYVVLSLGYFYSAQPTALIELDRQGIFRLGIFLGAFVAFLKLVKSMIASLRDDKSMSFKTDLQGKRVLSDKDASDSNPLLSAFRSHPVVLVLFVALQILIPFAVQIVANDESRQFDWLGIVFGELLVVAGLAWAWYRATD
jgi:hypothetical protein